MGERMEERQPMGRHQFQFVDRQRGNVTGVQDVISFDPEEVLLSTEQGLMTIKGEELHVSRLNLENQEIDLDGRIDSIVYIQEKPQGAKAGQSLLKRMFR